MHFLLNNKAHPQCRHTAPLVYRRGGRRAASAAAASARVVMIAAGPSVSSAEASLPAPHVTASTRPSASTKARTNSSVVAKSAGSLSKMQKLLHGFGRNPAASTPFGSAALSDSQVCSTMISPALHCQKYDMPLNHHRRAFIEMSVACVPGSYATFTSVSCMFKLASRFKTSPEPAVHTNTKTIGLLAL